MTEGDARARAPMGAGCSGVFAVRTRYNNVRCTALPHATPTAHLAAAPLSPSSRTLMAREPRNGSSAAN